MHHLVCWPSICLSSVALISNQYSTTILFYPLANIIITGRVVEYPTHCRLSVSKELLLTIPLQVNNLKGTDSIVSPLSTILSRKVFSNRLFPRRSSRIKNCPSNWRSSSTYSHYNKWDLESRVLFGLVSWISYSFCCLWLSTLPMAVDNRRNIGLIDNLSLY